jgi:hypothetical protein
VAIDTAGIDVVWIILYCVGMLWMFTAMAIVCDEYFVPGLEVIAEEIDEKVGSHTLRRFFGIVKWTGDFRLKTMDILAKYAGLVSINTFVEELRLEANLSDFLQNDQALHSDLPLYEKLIRNTPSIDSAMVIGSNILAALESNDIERVLKMLEVLEPFSNDPGRFSNITMLLGQYLGPSFYKIQEESVVEELMTATNYVDLVMSNFVPIMELDSGFGNHIKWMLDFSSNDEHHAFGNSLLATNAWRNAQNQEAKYFTTLAIQRSQNLRNIYPILEGRIDFLRRIQNDGINSMIKFQDFNPSINNKLLYFKAISIEIVLLKKKKWSQELFAHIELSGSQVNNWIEKSIMSMHELANFYGNLNDDSPEYISAQIELKKKAIWPKDHKQIALSMIAVIESDFKAN